MIKIAKLVVKLTGDKHINKIIDLLPYDELAPFMKWYLKESNLDKYVLQEETPTFLKDLEDEDRPEEAEEDAPAGSSEEQDKESNEAEAPASDPDTRARDTSFEREIQAAEGEAE